VTNATIALGAGLILLGVIAYFATDRASLTALLPAILGAPILLLGLLATREPLRRHAIHGALAIALLGLLGTAPQVIALPALLTGDDVERPAAVLTSTITAVACAVYVVAGVRSFIAARRSREAGLA
jgi:hypothetical protein